MRPLTAILLCLLPLVARAQIPSGLPTPMPHPLATLRVIVFAGGFNLPLWVADRNGYCAEQGLQTRLTNTPGSVYQMTKLLAGNYDIAMTTIDNVVAYDEGQGEVPIPPSLPSSAPMTRSFRCLCSPPIGPLLICATRR